MTTNQRRSIAAALLLAGSVPALLRSQPRGVTRTFKTWSQYLGGADSSQYSALDQINRSNVARLEVAWTYSTADTTELPLQPDRRRRDDVRAGEEQLDRGARPGDRDRRNGRAGTRARSPIAASTIGRAPIGPIAGCCT